MPDYPKVTQQISDPISENLAKLSELFPAAVKDGALDLEALRGELGDFEEIKPGDETYELNWVGKQAAKKEAFKPLLGKTLALKDDGKNSETTQNIYIEGDNLEALKLLRQNYYGEVKMIYIDPPYNTGKDFVYRDNFKTKCDESEQEEGAVADDGNRLIKNEQTSNRFHARWMDMMYSRLKLAKDLLSECGAIFISIDDNEVKNLRSIADEIFGEGNFLGCITVVSNLKGRSDDKHYATAHNYLLVYQKNNFENLGLPLPEEYLKEYTEIDQQGKIFRWQGLRKRGDSALKEDRPDMHYPFYANPDTLDLSITKTSEHTVEVLPYLSDGQAGRWRWGKETAAARISELKGRHVGPEKRIDVFQMDYAEGADGEKRIKPKSVWLGPKFSNEAGSLETKDLMGKRVFETPKPLGLIEECLLHSTPPHESVVIDFFSGSATTAHAVMNVNSKDGGTRKFIMVQLPELCGEESEAAKAGYRTIAEIGKERIRRAGQKIKEELQAKQVEWNKRQTINSKKGGMLELDDKASEQTNPYVVDPDTLDIGFKSFRIEDTKINWLKKDLRGEDIIAEAGLTTQDALDFVPGYTDTDVVYELMLRQSNIPLTGTITHPIATAKRTYLYADAYLICLEEKITQKLVEALAAIEPTPNKYFFRDSAFGTDIALKDETFRRLKAEIHKHHGDLGAAYTVEFI